MDTTTIASDTTPGSPATFNPWRGRLELFAFSFAALFLELMMIRWSPSVVRLVAYYANLMLISSFLGLGVGAMLARRKWDLFPFFPIFLAASVGFLLLAQHETMPTSDDESRFYASVAKGVNYLALAGIFFLNAAVFIPLGQRIGRLFDALPVLQAYAWDLGGSLAGTVIFGLFSLTYFSPVIGVSAIAAIYLIFAPRKSLAWAIPVLGLTLWAVTFTNDRHAIWSPYYYITIRDAYAVKYENERSPALSEPVPNVRTIKDPPEYSVSVNHDFYQPDLTLNYDRFSPERLERVKGHRVQYDLPYQIAMKHDRVLVLGAGGGTDAEVAILNGAQHVDAVEIDPVLVKLSKKFNPSGIYDDPRVNVHIDDARAFIQREKTTYDMVLFGWLDSQALFSYMSNLRLDGYIYTVQSIRQAYSLVEEDGTLTISFMAGRSWLVEKLIGMTREATGKDPIFYISSGQCVLVVPKTVSQPPPTTFGRFTRSVVPPDHDWSKVDLATDNWPYLYLARKAIPADYLAVIAILCAVSIPSLMYIRGSAFSTNDSHFLLMGVGFLLLQTKSIGDCSLYFGTTWFVTMVIIAGVLLMVLMANLLAMRLRRFSLWFYLPLLASLLLLYLVPRDTILSLGYAQRLVWSLLIVPLPIFFAGLIFSTTFRESLVPSALLGANLIGAMVGGFCEYLGMVTGTDKLMLIVMAAYLLSFLCRVKIGRLPDPVPMPA